MKSRVEFWRVQLTMCYYFITFNRRVLLIFQNVSLCVSIKLMECLEHMKRKLNTLKCIISPVVSKNRYLITRLTVMAFLVPFVIDSKVCLFLYILVHAINTITVDLSVSSRAWSLRLLCEDGLGQAVFWWTRFQAEISQAASCV